MNNKTIISLAVSSIFLSACAGGGGGGSSDSPSNNQLNIHSGNTTVSKPTHDKSDIVQKAQYDKNAAMSGKNVRVMLVDTGVDINKPVLRNKNIDSEMVHTTLTGTEKTSTRDTATHGTYMAETITNTVPDAQLSVVAFNKASISSILDNTAIYQKQKNADIINNSYTNGNTSDSQLNILRGTGGVDSVKKIIDSGALFLIATGNKGTSEPDNTTRMPDLDASLKQSFLAITGINYQGEQLYNKCGSAANYCVAALAYHHNTDNNGKNFLNGGTSSATAYVSGVAARVKSRYDFMKGKELRDVLVTTATDAGAEGIDTVYGQGIVNPDKAMNGYGRFDTTTTLNVSGVKDTYYFDNDISGKGGLVKQGNDSLVLNGNNTYTGGNVVTNGKLVLNGNNVSGVTVKRNGVLSVGDSANISSGSVHNDGKLVSNTTSDYKINGNFTNTSSATLEKAIGSKLDVTGNANLDGTLTLSGVAKGYVTTVGKTETLLSANNINGKFATINQQNVGDLIDNKVDVDNKTVSVRTSRKDVGTVAMTQSDYVGKDITVSNVTNLLNQYDAMVAKNTLHDGSASAELASEIINSTNLTQTLFEIGTETNKHAIENQSLSDGSQNVRFVEFAHLNKDGVWIDYTHNQSKLHLNGLNGHSHDNGFGMGVNKSFDNHTIAAGFNTTNSNWNEQFQGVAKSNSIDGYGLDASYGYKLNGYNMFGLLGYNWLKNKTSFGKSDMHQYAFGLGGSKNFVINDKLVLTPIAMVQYLKTKADTIQSSQHTSLVGLNNKRVVASLSGLASYAVSDKVSVTGKLSLEQDLHNKVAYTANYAGIQYENKSNDIAKTRVGLGLGVNFKPVDNLMIGTSVNHIRGNHWNNSSINMNMRYKF